MPNPDELTRKTLSYQWGPEIVVQCCRYWKLHITDGNWGKCGICKQRPKLTQLTWDELDEINN